MAGGVGSVYNPLVTDPVEIIEVGPRDGLQNDPSVLDPAVRADLVGRLLAAGAPTVEAASFVSPRAVPQMARAEEVVAGGDPALRERLTARVPNLRGDERAAAAGLRHGPAGGAAAGTMSRRNLNRSTDESMDGAEQVARAAERDGVRFGLAVGTSFGCPFEGDVDPDLVLGLAARGTAAGADEVVLADTTGMAHPEQVARL